MEDSYGWRLQCLCRNSRYVIEERELVTKTEAYLGGNIDGKDNGPELGIWELDLRSQFPLLFTSYEESQAEIPHSETIEKCSGRGSEITDSLGWRNNLNVTESQICVILFS